MIEKWNAIVNSPRAQQATLVMLFQLLQHLQVIDAYIANLLSVWIGAIFGVGVADSFATKLAGAPTVAVKEIKPKKRK